VRHRCEWRVGRKEIMFLVGKAGGEPSGGAGATGGSGKGWREAPGEEWIGPGGLTGVGGMGRKERARLRRMGREVDKVLVEILRSV